MVKMIVNDSLLPWIAQGKKLADTVLLAMRCTQDALRKLTPGYQTPETFVLHGMVQEVLAIADGLVAVLCPADGSMQQVEKLMSDKAPNKLLIASAMKQNEYYKNLHLSFMKSHAAALQLKPELNEALASLETISVATHPCSISSLEGCVVPRRSGTCAEIVTLFMCCLLPSCHQGRARGLPQLAATTSQKLSCPRGASLMSNLPG